MGPKKDPEFKPTESGILMPVDHTAEKARQIAEQNRRVNIPRLSPKPKALARHSAVLLKKKIPYMMIYIVEDPATGQRVPVFETTMTEAGFPLCVHVLESNQDKFTTPKQ